MSQSFGAMTGRGEGREFLPGSFTARGFTHPATRRFSRELGDFDIIFRFYLCCCFFPLFFLGGGVVGGWENLYWAVSIASTLSMSVQVKLGNFQNFVDKSGEGYRNDVES